MFPFELLSSEASAANLLGVVCERVELSGCVSFLMKRT
jgi:hypothetical protein